MRVAVLSDVHRTRAGGARAVVWRDGAAVRTTVDVGTSVHKALAE